jgi:hypothetical protein
MLQFLGGGESGKGSGGFLLVGSVCPTAAARFPASLSSGFLGWVLASVSAAVQCAYILTIPIRLGSGTEMGRGRVASLATAPVCGIRV